MVNKNSKLAENNKFFIAALSYQQNENKKGLCIRPFE